MQLAPLAFNFQDSLCCVYVSLFDFEADNFQALEICFETDCIYRVMDLLLGNNIFSLMTVMFVVFLILMNRY